MKTYKRILATLLCVVLTLTAAPLSGFVGLDLPSLFDFKADATIHIGFGTLDCEVRGDLLIAAGEGEIPDCASPSDVWWSDDRSDVKSAIIGNGITGIGNYVCYGCDNLTTLAISNSVERIGDYTFDGCTQLAEIYYFGTEEEWNNIEIGAGNDALSSAVIHFESAPVISDTCGSSTVWSLDLITGELVVSGNGDVYYPWEGGATLYWDEYALFVESIVIRDGITSISNRAFNCFNKLTSITVDVNNKHYSNDSYGVLFDKDKTELIQYPIGNIRAIYTIPDSVTLIGDGAFNKCDSLVNVTIPDSVTTIGDTAFCLCSNLTSLTIGNSVTTIGDEAFSFCNRLENISYSGTQEQWKKITIGSNNEDLTSAAIYYDSIWLPVISGECGDSLIWELQENGLLKIAGTGEMDNFEDGTEPWYRVKRSILQVVIENGVTTIGDGAFFDCNNLKSVMLGSDVKSIGWSAFSHCDSLINVTMPDSVTTIDNNAFYSCDSLTDIYYSGTQEQWNNISIGSDNGDLTSAEIHYKYYDYFGECGNSLTWMLNKSTGILNIAGKGEMWNYYYNPTDDSEPAPWFDQRSDVKTVYIVNGIKNIGSYAFSHCYNLTSVTIPDSITTIGDSAFAYCTSLTSVTIPDSVTTISGGAFYRCDSLTDVYYNGTQEQWNNISIGSGNSDLSTATIHFNGEVIPEEPTTAPIEEPTTVPVTEEPGTVPTTVPPVIPTTTVPPTTSKPTVPATTMPPVTAPPEVETCPPVIETTTKAPAPEEPTVPTPSYDYSGTCGNNLTWTLNKSTGVLNITGTGAMRNYSSSSSTPWYSYSIYIKTIKIGNSVTTIGNYAFKYCDSLTSVTIPHSVTTIGNYAFFSCDSLTSVTIPDSATSIGYRAFCYCDSLTSITVDENNQYYSSDSYGVLFNKDKTEIIQYPAGNTRKTYSIPDSVTTIDGCAFSNCDSLTSVTIPERVTAIADWVFSSCNSLTSITIPDGVTSIGNFAFIGCSSLTSITIPDGVTTIGDYAFEYCDSLASISIPNSVTTIGDYAFYNCDSLTSVNVDANNKNYSSDSYGVLFNKDKTTLVQYPIGNTRISYTIPDSVITIGGYAFSYCDSLTNVTIPDSVTHIGYSAFYSCGSLKDVYYTGTQEQWNKISIGSYNGNLTSATIHYNSTGPNSFIYSQSHVVSNYKEANVDYAAKYFAAMAQPMDGSNGTPDLCIPGLKLGDNMVPQGVAYYEAKNWLLVSSYYKDAETDSYPCYIYALDFTTGQMVAEYKLKEAESSTLHGHVGGIAVSNHNLYVTTDDSCIGYAPLSDLDKMNGEIIIREHTSMSEWLGNANTAYLSINDGMLITGNFFYAKDSKYDTPAKTANSVILAQNLSGNSSEQEWKNFCNSGPFAVVKVPDSVDRIQGVVYRDEKFFISSSLGRKNTSSLIIADIDKSNGYTLKNIYRFQAPPMMEGLTFADDYIYIVFESAAAFYREGLDGEGKSKDPTDVVWRISYNEWVGIDDTPTVTGDIENKYVQFNSGGVTGYTYLNFKQNWFSSDSMNYNHNLATLASQYVMIGYADEVSYSSKPDLEKALKAIGMSDIEIVAQAGKDEINYFIASRKITVNSQEYDLVFVGLIGSYHAQWYSNFDPGKGAIHKGFLSAKQFVYSALTDYIKDKGLSKDSTKILITGHSRGAAASNLLAADLIKGGVFAKPENIYTYCFATPNSTTLPERNEQRFKRIFNIVNPEDFVTKVLPTAWDYGRYGTTYVLPSKTNTMSSLYSAYRTNMQHYYGAFTQGDTYRPYIGGEADTRLVVESMISSIDNVNEFYDKTLWVGIIPMSAYDFFQNSLCHIVSKEASAADWAYLAIIVEGTLVTPTAPDVFKNVLTYFLLNGTGLNPCFENAHKAETYCAYMMAMSETQIKQTRKGYLNTVNCPVDVEVIDKATGEVVGRIVNNVVDEEIAAKENAVVMSVDGDSKSFWLPSDGDYEVRLIGNGEGTMDYTVAEIDPDLGETERINFFDVEITEGKELTGDVPAYDFELEEYTLKTDSSEEVPDQKLDAESGEITITTSVEGDGYVTNTLTVKSGDYVSLTAQPVVTAKFVKWVDSSGKTLSTDAEYSFVAKENTTVKAVFTTAEGIKIKTPSKTTINYGDTLVLHADIAEIPEGYSILWTVEGSGFNMSPADDDLTCKMTSVANGNATVKATLVDGNGDAVLDAEGNEMSDTQELKSNASFWQKIVSFFKNLFRINRTIPE